MIQLATSLRRALAVFGCTVSLLGPLLDATPVMAQSPEEVSKARAQFQRGIELEQAQNWGGALKAFREVGQFKMTPQVRYHIALCEEKLGKLVAALGGYELALADAESVGGAFKEEVEASVNDLRARIPKVVIERGAGAEAASIELDGVALGASSVGVEVPIDPGPHSLVATAAGYEDFSDTIQVGEEETKTVSITMTAVRDDDDARFADPGGPEDDGAKKKPGKQYGVMPYVFAGVGGAFLVTGVAMNFFLRRPLLQELKRECTKDDSGNYGCPPDFKDVEGKNSTLETYDIVVPVTLGVGVAALGTGVVLYVLDMDNESASGMSTPSPKLRVSATAPGADVGGLSVSGTF